VLDANPFTTLQLVLEPAPGLDPGSVQDAVSPRLLARLTAACQERPTYLDRFYALQPGRPNGAKRLVVLLPADLRPQLQPDWIEEVGASATLVWRGSAAAEQSADGFESFEYSWTP
jgi:hypothetical protein